MPPPLQGGASQLQGAAARTQTHYPTRIRPQEQPPPLQGGTRALRAAENPVVSPRRN